MFRRGNDGDALSVIGQRLECAKDVKKFGKRSPTCAASVL
jgi:hypothetical protein